MATQRKFKRDPFAFSLGGHSVMASFMAPVIVADDRLKAAPKPPAAPRTESLADWQTAEQPGC
ncbi:MAG: hypothetical protein AAFS02_14935 [Pseudomonadota bacterium]